VLELFLGEEEHLVVLVFKEEVGIRHIVYSGTDTQSLCTKCVEVTKLFHNIRNNLDQVSSGLRFCAVARNIYIYIYTEDLRVNNNEDLYYSNFIF